MSNPTYRQFSQDMRAAGWRNERQGWWVHTDTNSSFYAFNGVPHANGGFCEAWVPYAEAGKLPPVGETPQGGRESAGKEETHG